MLHFLVVPIFLICLVSLLACSGPPSPPSAPLEITPVGPHAVMVEWGAPESDGGAPLDGYKIAVRDARRQMWMEVGRVAADVQKLKVQDLAVSALRNTLERIHVLR